MVPALSCVWHTTPQRVAGCGYASLPKTTPTAANGQLCMPGTHQTTGRKQASIDPRQAGLLPSVRVQRRTETQIKQLWNQAGLGALSGSNRLFKSHWNKMLHHFAIDVQMFSICEEFTSVIFVRHSVPSSQLTLIDFHLLCHYAVSFSVFSETAAHTFTLSLRFA